MLDLGDSRLPNVAGGLPSGGPRPRGRLREPGEGRRGRVKHRAKVLSGRNHGGGTVRGDGKSGTPLCEA